METTMTTETTTQEPETKQKKRRFQWKKIKKKWIAIAVILALAVGYMAFSPKKAQTPVSTYSQATAEYRDISVKVNGSSTVSPKDSYTVISLVQGEILEAPFEEGDTIEKGDLLYQIDTSNAENNVKAAQVGVEQAQVALDNAQISYRSIQKTLDDLNQTSNYTGQITQLLYDPGDTVSAGQPIAQLTDSKTMLLKLPFHSSDAEKITVGQSASVTMTATGETLAGTVTAVSSVDTVGTGGVITREVEISVSNPGGITQGAYATALVGSYGCAASGTFSYQASKSILATASGEVKTLNVQEGDWVTSGQTILTLDSSDLADQLDSAANAVANAELSLENAKLSLDNAEKALDDYTITAPISGTVVEKNYKVGDKLDNTSATASLAVIYDMSQLEFEMSIDELYIGQIEVGQEVVITADALPGETFQGVVDRIGIRGTSTSGVTAYPVTVKLTDSGSLLPGMNITADILIEEATHLLTIPLSAVSRGNTVLVADPNSAGDSEANIPAGYRQVEVTLGRSDSDYVEVLSGLEEGDVVAIDTSTSNIFEQMMVGMY